MGCTAGTQEMMQKFVGKFLRGVVFSLFKILKTIACLHAQENDLLGSPLLKRE